MPLILPTRNPLVYPCGVAPGFDPSHPMSDRIRFSGFVSGGNFVELLSGLVGVLTGTPTPSIDSSTGPAIQFTSSLNYSAFSGRPTTNDTAVTIAAIFRNAANGQTNGLFTTCSAGSNSGWRVSKALAGNGRIIMTAGGVADVSATINIPRATGSYFVAASANASLSAVVLLDLETGQLLRASGTGASSAASDGTYRCGYGNSVNEQMRSPISHIMLAAKYHSLSELVAWASDIWSFWYPRKAQNRIAAQSGFPWWAVQNNIPVLGTGVY